MHDFPSSAQSLLARENDIFIQFVNKNQKTLLETRSIGVVSRLLRVTESDRSADQLGQFMDNLFQLTRTMVFAQMFFNFPLFGRGQGLIPADEVDKVKKTIYLRTKLLGVLISTGVFYFHN